MSVKPKTVCFLLRYTLLPQFCTTSVFLSVISTHQSSLFAIKTPIPVAKG